MWEPTLYARHPATLAKIEIGPGPNEGLFPGRRRPYPRPPPDIIGESSEAGRAPRGIDWLVSQPDRAASRSYRALKLSPSWHSPRTRGPGALRQAAVFHRRLNELLARHYRRDFCEMNDTRVSGAIVP